MIHDGCAYDGATEQPMYCIASSATRVCILIVALYCTIWPFVFKLPPHRMNAWTSMQRRRAKLSAVPRQWIRIRKVSLCMVVFAQTKIQTWNGHSHSMKACVRFPRVSLVIDSTSSLTQWSYLQIPLHSLLTLSWVMCFGLWKAKTGNISLPRLTILRAAHTFIGAK